MWGVTFVQFDHRVRTIPAPSNQVIRAEDLIPVSSRAVESGRRDDIVLIACSADADQGNDHNPKATGQDDKHRCPSTQYYRACQRVFEEGHGYLSSVGL